jgi:hypothetical protein
MKPLLARSFNCIVQLWEAVNVPDGFGGYTVNEVLVGDIFARRIEARANNYSVVAGVIDKYDQSFVIRKRNIDTSVNFIVYNDYKYTILSLEGTQLETQIKLNCVNTNTLRVTPIQITFGDDEVLFGNETITFE